MPYGYSCVIVYTMKLSKSAALILTFFCVTSGLNMFALSDTQLRQALIEAGKRDVDTVSRNSLSTDTLGEWQEVLDTVTFLIFRQTELYRGPLTIVVVDSPDTRVRFYYTGSLAVPTGLLDAIDERIFIEASETSRRIRDIQLERQQKLAPAFAFEAARLALDIHYQTFVNAVHKGEWPVAAIPGWMEPSADETAKADRLVPAILSIAGFTPALQLDALKHGSSSSVLDRILSIQEGEQEIERVNGELRNVFALLRTGFAPQEALMTLNGLSEQLNNSYWIDRLTAIILHQLWLESVPPAERLFVWMPGAATRTDQSHDTFMALATQRGKSRPRLTDRTPGNRDTWRQAVSAWGSVNSRIPDPVCLSALASLLVFGEGNGDRENALSISAQAAAIEKGGSSFTARNNHALIEFLAGESVQRVVDLFDTIAPVPLNEVTLERTYEGFTGDSRELGINRALIQSYEGQRPSPDSETPGPAADNTVATTDVRGIRAGDSADLLLERWGKPAEIHYNFVAEVWVYPSLDATVLMLDRIRGGVSAPRIESITIGPNSPITLGKSIRTGDTKKDFETVFGPSRWLATDRSVFIHDGQELSVLFLSDKIQSITVHIK